MGPTHLGLYIWKSSRDAKLTNQIHLLQRLRMSGDVPLLPIYAFTAWTETMLPLPLLFSIIHGYMR